MLPEKPILNVTLQTVETSFVKMDLLSLKVLLLFIAQCMCNQEAAKVSNSGGIPSDISLRFNISKIDDVSSHDNIALTEDITDSSSSNNRDQINEDIGQTLEGEVVVNAPIESLAETANVILNSSSTNSSNGTDISEEKGNVTNLVACNTGKENGGLPVELVNSTRLVSILITETNITDRRTNADCTLVLFYARYCPFSSMAAPHFNALPRAFPDIKLVAVDAMKYHSFNTQYGIVGVPTVMLFHNGRPAAKFNDSEYNLEAFAKFITKYTGIQPHDKLYVTSADFGGPVSSVPTKETDYCLILSWAFMFVCGLYFFSKSSWWHWISEAVLNTWREAEAQHEHGD